MFSFFKHKNTIRETDEEFLAKSSYDAIQKLTAAYIKELSAEDNEKMLDYLLDTVTRDLCTSMLAKPLYQGYSNSLFVSFPTHYYDKNGIKRSIEDEEVAVELNQAHIYLSPWNNERTKNNLLNLFDKEFHYDELNHVAFYFPDINLCHIANGNHSINAGRYLKKGTILATQCDIKKLFPHVCTDGYKWYNTHSGEPFGWVGDFRLSAIYLIAKTKHQLN